jgi:hypothetical protein
LLFGSPQADPSGADRRPVRRAAIEVPSGDPGGEEGYRLAHCQGFAVVEAGVAAAVVSDVRFRSRLDRPDELEITTGRFRHRRCWVSVAEVSEVSLEREEVTLAHGLPRSSSSRVRASARALRGAILRRPSPADG